MCVGWLWIVNTCLDITDPGSNPALVLGVFALPNILDCCYVCLQMV